MESAKKYQNSKDFYKQNPEAYELHKQKALDYYYRNKERICQRNKEKRLNIKRLAKTNK